MKIDHQVVVFDAADLEAESRFWAGVLAGTVDAEDDWRMVVVDGTPRVGVQLWVENFEEAHATVTSLGATVLKPAEDGPAPDAFQVYADPAGHPFCLCWIKADQAG